MKAQLHHSYNALVRRAHAYLTERREQGKWERYLPARVFDPSLWLWEQRSVARGAGWGGALAITPIPLQSLAAAFFCLWVRGNVPVGMLSCWISFPGYQIIAWPLQWALGAAVLSLIGVDASGMSWSRLSTVAEQWHRGWEAMLVGFQDLSVRLFLIEFFLGCVLSAACLGGLLYGIVRMLPRRLFAD